MNSKETLYRALNSKTLQGILTASIFAFLVIGFLSSLMPKDVGILVFSE